MNWKKSTTPSVFMRSSMAWIHTKAPLRPIPSLQDSHWHSQSQLEPYHGTHTLSNSLAHDSDGLVAGVLLSASELLNEPEEDLGAHAALLSPARQVVLRDAE